MIASFYTRQLEVVLVGLENSGKTTLMNGKGYCEKVKTCQFVKVVSGRAVEA